MNRQLQNACNDFYDRSASLTMLNLSGRGIGSTGMKRLADSCCEPRPPKITRKQLQPYRSPLVCLWLENNYLYPSSAEDLARLIAVSPCLRHVHLSHNSLSNQGAKIVSLACFSQVQVCNLTDNEIGVDGARFLAEKLIDRKCVIKTLILDSNRLGDEGAEAIAEALKHNTSLKSLDLRYCDISRRGLLLLREVLLQRDNMTLEVLHLEEEQDENCLPRLIHKHRTPTEAKPLRRVCGCDRCQIKSDIDFYLALNKAGRHSFSDVDFSTALWPRILAKSSRKDPSLLHAAICERPDIAMRNHATLFP